MISPAAKKLFLLLISTAFETDSIEFETDGQRQISSRKSRWSYANPVRSGLRIRAGAFRELRDTVSKLSKAGFENCHRIRICERRRFTVRY